MRYSWPFTFACAVVVPLGVIMGAPNGSAAEIRLANLYRDGTPILDIRYRFELVDQDGFDRDAKANTVRTRFGFEPVKELALEIGYDSGRSTLGPSLYNAYTFGALFRPNTKWEFEGQYVFRTDNSERLTTSVIVRRFGHDMVFEMETRTREGEGSGVAFGLRPILVWKNRGLGFLDQHRDGRW